MESEARCTDLKARLQAAIDTNSTLGSRTLLLERFLGLHASDPGVNHTGAPSSDALRCTHQTLPEQACPKLPVRTLWVLRKTQLAGVRVCCIAVQCLGPSGAASCSGWRRAGACLHAVTSTM